MSHRSNDRGAAALVALLGIAFLVYYAQTGYIALSAYLAPMHHLAGAALIGVITLFATSYAVYCFFLGSKSPSSKKRIALRRAEEAFNLVQTTNARIASIEQRMVRNMLTTDSEGMRVLGSLKRISRALLVRVREVESLLASWSSSDVALAYELMTSKALTVEDNALEWVMDSEQLPPLSPDTWALEIDRLLRYFEADSHQAAA